MISFSFLNETRYRVAILALVFGAILFLATFLDGAYEDYSKATDQKLGLQAELNFPLREVSGLHLGPPHPDDGSREVLVIGDHTASLGVARLQGLSLSDKQQVDFSGSILKRFSVCKSKKIAGCADLIKELTTQWEAVATDASGKVFLLHEQMASLFVYDRQREGLAALINLDSFDLDADRSRKKATADQENALGEGFVLLKNGHILVVKERFKPAIVEFGFAGESPQGYEPTLHGDGQFTFPLPEEQAPLVSHTMVPLKVWPLPSRFRNCDLAELSSDAHGGLYLLSQQCQWIAKLQPNLTLEDKELKLAALWAIPSKIKNAEALAVINETTFLVGEDRKSLSKNNLFILSLPNPSLPIAKHRPAIPNAPGAL